jgi:ubiquinone/menaquinone biosynthesis C-methylase UbiE
MRGLNFFPGFHRIIWLGAFLIAAPFPQKYQRYDAVDKKRDAMFEQHRILDIGGLKAGMVVGEVGAGDGYLTFHLAERVGPTGRVYANDIVETKALEVIRARAEEKGVTNIVTVLGTEEDPHFPKAALDMAFFLNSFHEIRKPVELLGNLAPSLKPGAKVVIHEWESEKPADPGAGGDRTYTRQEFLDIVAKTTFKVVQIETELPGPNPAVYILALKDSSPAQQKTAALLEELNAQLANFCYNKPKLEIAADGMVVRKDIDGTAWKFDFGDIGDITIEREGESHVVLPCRGNNGCIERSLRGGTDRLTSSFLAFSLRPADRGDDVLELFKQIQAALKK